MRRALLALLSVATLAGTARAGTFERAYKLLDEWRIAEADRELSTLQREKPRAPETLFLEGDLAFLHGDYAGAADKLKAAEKQLGRGELAAEAAELAGLATSTLAVTKGMTAHPGAHFVIYAGPDDELLVPYAQEALEKAYTALAADFGDETQEPIRVEIYSEVADLARVSTLTLKEIETSGTIALCKYNKLMITSPRALLAGYPWLDTLNHEYTHFVVSRVSHNTVPIWLHEGLAKFEEQRWRGQGGGGLSPTSEHLLAMGLAKKHLITFEEMHPSMAKLPSQEDTALAFAEVYMMVAWLKQTIGWEGIRRVVAGLRDGRSDAQAMAQVVGKPFPEIQREWRGWLGQQKLKTWPGLFPTELRFRKGAASKKAGSGDDDLNAASTIKQKEAKQFARLGAMLRNRHRLRAAAAEYERAQALLGAGNPQVSHTLGRVYLELGDADHAIAVVEPAMAAYPDQAGPHATLGRSYLAKGRDDDAEKQLLLAVAISPFDPAVHCALEKVYTRRVEAGRGDVGRRDREAAACRELAK